MPETRKDPPQYDGHYYDPQDLDRHVVVAIQAEAAQRLQRWETLALNAVDEFQTAANQHIDELDYEHAASVDMSPVLASFASVVLSKFEPTATAYDVVSTVMGGFESAYEDRLSSGLSSGKKRLRDAVVALAQASRLKTNETVTELIANLPDIVDDAMTWVDSASVDPIYVRSMCDWMGLPLPSRQNTVHPIRQSLENPFFGVYQAVRAQLLRTQGVPGLHDDDLVPRIWQHEAIEYQRKVYNEAQVKEEAWEEVYDELQA